MQKLSAPIQKVTSMKSTHQKLTALAVLGMWIASGAIAIAAPAGAPAPRAAVTIVRARALAKHVVPGTILSEELEKEAGGSGLRYTFEIRGAFGVREIGIDAQTGKVLENSADQAPNTKAGGDPAESGD
jgi:uncharacterized membrane protein YkoI